MNNRFKAGSSRVKITPPPGTIINGDFVRYYAREVHDDLYAKALALSDDNTTLVIVMVDICVMKRELIDQVKERIREELGIPPENIMIASTHTHFAGSVADLLMVPADKEYMEMLPGLLIETVDLALKNFKPAQIAWGSVDAPEHVVCRRFFMKESFIAWNPVTGKADEVKTNPFGNEHLIDRRVSKMDTELSFLAVKGTDEQWISLLANFSLHYVGDCPPGTITADYFGTFSRHIEKGLDSGNLMVAMMSNGTSGEANIWDFLDPNRYPKGNFEKSEFIGKDLALKVLKKINDLEWDNNPELDAMYEDLEVAVRKPSQEELEKANIIYSQTDYGKLKVYDGSRLIDQDLVKVYAREQVLLSEYPDRVVFPVQAFKIGKGKIGALGGEFFAETGLRLKSLTGGSPYFTITMANGYTGYVPPENEINRGGYETWRCRSSYLDQKEENRIRKTLGTLIEKLA